MKGDFSRLTFNKDKHYSSVRMQQGRVQLDADWNEQADISTYQRETLAEDKIGAHGAPKDNAGYEISVLNNSLMLGQGRYYVKGILCENPTAVSYEQQTDLPGAKQPAAAEDAGIYVAYLETWHHHQTSVNDQNLQEVAIGGTDTTTRTKIVSPVKLSKLGDLPTEDSPQDYVASLLASVQQLTWHPAGSKRTGNLKARVATGFAGELENQLLRIEVHQAGEAGTATFKWSSNNGILTAAITDGPTVTEGGYSINIIPGEWDFGFIPGQWVEITDDQRLLANQPGIMVKLTEVSDVQLVFSTEDESIQEIGRQSLATVRQWDSEWNTDTQVISSENYVQLGNGVEVGFGEGTYQTGDSWLIPCRALLGNVLWPEDLNGDPIASEAHNTDHQHAPLALLTFDGFAWALEKDLRKLFWSTTEISEEKVSRGGDTMYGALIVQETITGEKDLIVHEKLEVKGAIGVGTSNPEKEIEVVGTVKATAFDAESISIGVANPEKELEVEGTVRATFFEGDGSKLTGLEGWEYEHVIIRGIQGGGYAGSTVTNLIHQTSFATETTSRVPGATMNHAKGYGAGVSGRKHGYFIGSNDWLNAVGGHDQTDKFIHATNVSQYLLGNPFTVNTGSNPYTFSDERAEQSFYGTGTQCNEQIKIDNATDTQVWKRISAWSASNNGGGGFHDEVKGWASSGASSNTLGFYFKTETFYNIPNSHRNGADPSDMNNSLNTRKGFGYKISSNGASYQYMAHKFNFTTETWSRVTDVPKMHSEAAWHGGENKGYSIGGYTPQNGHGYIMDYATNIVVYAGHMNAPIAICSTSINNSAI